MQNIRTLTTPVYLGNLANTTNLDTIVDTGYYRLDTGFNLSGYTTTGWGILEVTRVEGDHIKQDYTSGGNNSILVKRSRYRRGGTNWTNWMEVPLGDYVHKRPAAPANESQTVFTKMLLQNVGSNHLTLESTGENNSDFIDFRHIDGAGVSQRRAYIGKGSSTPGSPFQIVTTGTNIQLSAGGGSLIDIVSGAIVYGGQAAQNWDNVAANAAARAGRVMTAQADGTVKLQPLAISGFIKIKGSFVAQPGMNGITITGDPQNTSATTNPATAPNPSPATDTTVEGYGYIANQYIAALLIAGVGTEIQIGDILAWNGTTWVHFKGSEVLVFDETRGVHKDLATNTISAKIDAGLSFDADGEIQVNVGNGVEINPANEVALRHGDGIGFDAAGLNVARINRGLMFDATGQIEARLGTGLQFNAGTGAIDVIQVVSGSFDITTANWTSGAGNYQGLFSRDITHNFNAARVTTDMWDTTAGHDIEHSFERVNNNTTRLWVRQTGNYTVRITVA